MSLFGKGVGRSCAVVATSTASKMTAQIRHALRQTPTVELRLDWLRSDLERSKLLAWVAKNRPSHATFLATCRRRAGGGLFHGTPSAELSWLSRAREAGCAWGDLEIESVRALPHEFADRTDLPLLLLSVHNFRETPEKMLLSQSGRFDAVKIAAQSGSIADSLRVLRLARKMENCVAVPMGGIGLPARIPAPREGRALASGPGSPPNA